MNRQAEKCKFWNMFSRLIRFLLDHLLFVLLYYYIGLFVVYIHLSYCLTLYRQSLGLCLGWLPLFVFSHSLFSSEYFCQLSVLLVHKLLFNPVFFSPCTFLCVSFCLSIAIFHPFSYHSDPLFLLFIAKSLGSRA